MIFFTEAILVHTFLAGDVIRLKIHSTGGKRLYLASTPGGTISTAAELTAMAEESLPVGAFGDIDLSIHRFLTSVSTEDVIIKLRIVPD